MLPLAAFALIFALPLALAPPMPAQLVLQQIHLSDYGNIFIRECNSHLGFRKHPRARSESTQIQQGGRVADRARRHS